MQLAIIEPSKTGAEHASFNMAVTAAVHALLGDKVRLYASASQFRMLNINIAWTRIPVISITRRSFVKKALVETVALGYSLINARLHGYRNALLLSIFPPLLNMLPLLEQLTGVRTHVVLHGELDGLLDLKRQRMTSYGYWVKRFFDRKRYKKAGCIVLGSGIQRRLAEYYPDTDTRMLSVNHPINRGTASGIKKDIPFATFGIATMERFADLYERISSLSDETRPQLVHIGMCEEKLFHRFRHVVRFLCEPGKSLTITEYEEAASRVQCALSLYASSDYRLRVSAAMLDALGAGAQLLALPCSYAQDLQRDGFNVVLVESVDEVVTYMLNNTRPTQKAVPEEVWRSYSDSEFARRVIENLA